MAKHPFKSRQLRQLAEQFLQEISDDEVLSGADHQELATSLVRQWITYDGNATLFIGDRQIYLTLAMTSLGQLRLVPVAGVHDWLNQVIQDWKLDTEELPEIIGQLNRGQSIEVVDHDGLPLRLCVDPKEKRNGVERLVKEPNPPAPKRDYHKIAAGQLKQVFGSELEPEAVDELASSVVKQWQNFDGHASLFDDDQQFSFTFTEKDGGFCEVVASRSSVNVESELSSLSVRHDMITAVIFRINLGHRVEFLDTKGVPSILWHDPKTNRFMARAITSRPTVEGTDMRPILCPHCRAVLKPCSETERHQTCRACGRVAFGN